MNILHKKLSLPFYGVIALWTLILITSVLVFLLLVTVVMDMTVFTRKHFEASFAYPVFICEAVLIALWRKSTFRLRDLVRIMKLEGVQVKKRNPIFLLMQSCFFWSFPQGSLNGSFVIAKINGAYNLPLGLGDRTHLTAESVLIDRIDFISLICGPFTIDEEIRIDKTNRKIPNTGVPEIDTVLQETLRDTDDFRARLIFNNEYFRLIVISSPWLGGRYEKRVVKGFEIFKKADEALRKKYPHRKWESFEMKWNGHKYEFEPKRISS